MTQQCTRLTAATEPGNRRLGIIPGRRFAVALVVCLGLIALPCSAAVADDSAPLVQATVYTSGGQPTADAASPSYLLANPSQCPVYSGGTLNEYGRNGSEPTRPSPTRSWTLGTILGCLTTPIALANVTGVTVVGSDGAPQTGAGSQLTPADLATPSDFLNPAQNPLVQSVGWNQYDRPQRNQSDLDYDDEIIQTNSPIAIEVFEGPPLSVTATASPTTVTVGGVVDFSAAVTGNNGSTLSYNWSFGGGAPSSTQPAPQVQFNTPGVWTVNVEVTDADGGGGGDQRTVTVTQPGSASTPTSTGPTTTGPDKSSGPTPGAPPSRQKKTGTQNPGTHHAHGKGTHTTSTQSQTTTTQTTTTQSTTTPVGGASGGSSGSSGSSGAGSASTTSSAGQATTGQKAPPAPIHRATPKPISTASGALVRGQLISDVIPLPADRSPLVHLLAASSASAPARQALAGPSVLPIAGAALAILALLGLGAQRELGRPRWWPALRPGH